MSIRKTNSSDSQLWNEYVLNHPNAGPYHLWEWRDTISEAYKHSPYYLMSEEAQTGKVVGVLPLIYIKPPFARGLLVSLPFCDYGGPVSDKNDVEFALCREALNRAESLGAGLELRCNHPLSHECHLRQFGDKARLILELPENSEVLFKKFKSKLRSQIRRSIKEGLFSNVGGRELIRDFYRVFGINMRDLGSPVHSRCWFEALMTYFDEKARIGIVYKEKTPVACGIILLHTDTVSIPWASSLRSFNRFSPNMLLYWSFLEFAADNGYKRFDFGRSSPGSGTFRFKKQWGAEPRPLFWYSDSKAHDTVAPGSGKTRALAEKVWMKLPSCVSNYLGPKIRKYISL